MATFYIHRVGFGHGPQAKSRQSSVCVSEAGQTSESRKVGMREGLHRVDALWLIAEQPPEEVEAG